MIYLFPVKRQKNVSVAFASGVDDYCTPAELEALL